MTTTMYFGKITAQESEVISWLFLNDLMKYGSSDSPQDMGGYHDYKEFYTNEVDNQGVVDKMDKYSNEDYTQQLPE